MKILIILLMFPILAQAQEKYFAVNYNLMTHHFSTLGASKFENKISSDGRTIDNKLIGIEFVETGDLYSKISLFGGEDSIGSPMAGFYKSFGSSYSNSGFNAGLLYGAYFFDQSEWDKVFEDSEAKTPSIVTATMGIENVNIIFGFELNYHIPLGKDKFIKINNVITPFISIHGVGIGFSY